MSYVYLVFSSETGMRGVFSSKGKAVDEGVRIISGLYPKGDAQYDIQYYDEATVYIETGADDIRIERWEVQ